MKVKVTVEDIRNGQRHTARGCPVALALTHAFGHAWSALGMLARSCDGMAWAILPQCAVLFQRDFDLGLEDLKPFAFELNPRGVS